MRNIKNKIKINKKSDNKLLSILYILLLTIALFQTNVFFKVNMYTKYIIAMIFIMIGFISIAINKEMIIDKIKFNITMGFLLPYILIILYSLVILLVSGETRISYLTRSISTGLYNIIALIFAISVIYLFKKNIVNYTFYACVINYSLVILKYFKLNGIDGFINFSDYNNNYVSSVLEVHGLTFIFGLFSIYYIFFESEHKKYKNLKIIISLLYFYLGFKRIALLALSIVIVLGLIIKKQKENEVTKLQISIMLILLFIAYLYLYFIKSGKLSILEETYNINFMSRLKFFDLFKDKYDLSILFWGHGLGFTDKVMAESLSILNISNITSIHNDILRIYIDIGFVGSLLYFFNMLILQLKRIFKWYNINITLVYFLLTTYTFINYFTDNLLTHFNYVFVYFIICLTIINKRKLKV